MRVCNKTVLISLVALALSFLTVQSVLAESSQSTPVSAVREYLLSVLTSGDLGRNGGWHSKSEPLVKSMLELNFSSMVLSKRLEYSMAGKVSEYNEIWRTAVYAEEFASFELDREHSDRALVYVYMGSAEPAFTFAVAAEEGVWRILTLVAESDEDPWSAFEPLDKAEEAKARVASGGWKAITKYWAYKGITMKQVGSSIHILGEILRTEAATGLLPTSLRIVLRDAEDTVIGISSPILLSAMEEGDIKAFEAYVTDLSLSDVRSWTFQID